MTTHEQPFLNDGFSAFRPVVESSLQPTANLLTERYGTNQHVTVRRFDTDMDKTPGIRVCTTQETRERFFDELRMTAPDILAAARDALPSIATPIPLTFSHFAHRQTTKGAEYVAGIPDTATQEYLQHERNTVLAGVEYYADVAQTAWDARDFELVLATFKPDTNAKKQNSVLQLIKSTCPEQITLGGLFFQCAKARKTI